MLLDPALFCAALSERLRLTGYLSVEVFEGAVKGFRGKNEIFIHVWEEGAMSVVFAEKSHQGLHLNYWTVRGTEPEDPITAMWDRFWECEQENIPLGRLLWMHGSTLKRSPTEGPSPVVPEEEQDVFSIFGP
mgnify:CR=1 FL=1